MATTKFTLLIPIYYNDGREVPRPVLDKMLNELFELANGYTLLPNVEGAYRMKDGSKQIDRHMAIWVGVPDEQVVALRRLVGRIGAELGQEAMYLEKSGGTIELVPPIEGDGNDA